MTNFQFIRKEAITLIDETFAAHNGANSTTAFERQPKARDGDPLIYQPSFREEAFGLSFTFTKLNQGVCNERFDGNLSSKIMVTAFADGQPQANYFYHQNMENPAEGSWVVFLTDEGAGALAFGDVPVEGEFVVGELGDWVGGLIGFYTN